MDGKVKISARSNSTISCSKDSTNYVKASRVTREAKSTEMFNYETFPLLIVLSLKSPRFRRLYDTPSLAHSHNKGRKNYSMKLCLQSQIERDRKASASPSSPGRSFNVIKESVSLLISFAACGCECVVRSQNRDQQNTRCTAAISKQREHLIQFPSSCPFVSPPFLASPRSTFHEIRN